MLSIEVCLLFSMVILVSTTPIPTKDPSPWAKEPEYFRALEHGFRLDATQHHIHFVDRGMLYFKSLQVIER